MSIVIYKLEKLQYSHVNRYGSWILYGFLVARVDGFFIVVGLNAGWFAGWIKIQRVV